MANYIGIFNKKKPKPFGAFLKGDIMKYNELMGNLIEIIEAFPMEATQVVEPQFNIKLSTYFGDTKLIDIIIFLGETTESFTFYPHDLKEDRESMFNELKKLLELEVNILGAV